MSAKIIDGVALAQQVRNEVAARVNAIVAKGQRPPRLSVILVGNDPASQVYVGGKEKACSAVGISTDTLRLPDHTSEAELLSIIKKLNTDTSIDGILVQLPLPKQIDRLKLIQAIDWRKDVDGLTPFNQGLVEWSLPGLYPCTPLGIMRMIESTRVTLDGAEVTVIGRSNLVGAPTATLLSHAGATVTIVHSRTQNPEKHSRNADVLVAAAGKRHLVKGSWIKKGAVVIDVGIHSVTDSDGTRRLTGDVEFESASKVAGFISPVPKGVGPMTIAMLLSNCVTAREQFL